jgi:hypothetical protein
VATDTTGNAAEYTTAAFTCGAYRLVLCLASTTDTVLPDEHSITSLHGTWTQIANTNYHTIGTPLAKVTLWRLMTTTGTVSSTLTNKFSNGATGSGLGVIEWSGVNTSGSDGSGAVVQVKMNALDGSAGPTVTLSELSGNRNGVFGGVSDDEGTGYAAQTSLTTDFNLNHNNPFMTFYGGHRSNTTNAVITLTDSASRDYGFVGVEIKVQY